MGWSFQSSLQGHAGPREYLDAQYTHQTPERRVRVLRSAFVAMRVYYAAVEVIRPGEPRRVHGVVCLVKYNLRDREGYIFGSNDMDETMGPYESACPAAILDLLTPTDNALALDWRARCRGRLTQRTAQPRLKNGMTVVFAQPIAFGDGRNFDRLTVVIDPRRPRSVRFRSPDSPALYRVSRMQDREFRVEIGG